MCAGRTGRPASVRRFLSEAKAIGKLEHPGIPPIYELGTDGHGNPFFAQRLIVGQDLAKIIEQMKLGDHDLHQRFRFQRRLEVFFVTVNLNFHQKMMQSQVKKLSLYSKKYTSIISCHL